MILGSNVVLRSSMLVAQVSPLGAELQHLATIRGRELQWGGDPDVWSGRAPILFPVVGMLRDGVYRLDGKTYAMPKHGFARHSTFALMDRSQASATFRLDASEETRSTYPFAFRLDVTITLADATLTLAATISNMGDTSMPAGFGFHPALRWPLPFGRPRAEHRIVFDRDEPAPVRRIDAQGLLVSDPRPTPIEGRSLALRDDLFVDDALIFDRVASRRIVYGAPGASQIAVDFPDLPTLGVWTKPGAGFICIEPWSGLPTLRDSRAICATSQACSRSRRAHPSGCRCPSRCWRRRRRERRRRVRTFSRHARRPLTSGLTSGLGACVARSRRLSR